jgi:hypothetical protein
VLNGRMLKGPVIATFILPACLESRPQRALAGTDAGPRRILPARLHAIGRPLRAFGGRPGRHPSAQWQLPARVGREWLVLPAKRATIMPELTRRRDPDAQQEPWLIDYGVCGSA